MYSLSQDLSHGTVIIDLVTLTLKFDLLLRNFNFCYYLVMVAARRAWLSSDNSYWPSDLDLAFFCRRAMLSQTSRRQKYFTGHSVWWRTIFHPTESKFAGPKSLCGILTNKSEISLVATFLCPRPERSAQASSNRIVRPFVRPSVCLSVRNSVPLTNKVQ